ncbi:uncharacterized protein LOC122631924 [Vespula pensylvanica]|uniref:BZIP domain-containing protein n=1 Tax=Vespula pensylvanica TaxID=30213 RepID=A0A834U887_VESPE|nr:uncharacterized protein LOC122631924 [Vespula pensylvanica]KAF7420710.1 hypothetical protein H0235_011007 [Vespula pensylvanica]
MSSTKHFNKKKYASSSDEEEVGDVNFKRNCKTLLRSNREENLVFSNNTVEQTRRRGRGPSKRPCLNRNALMARENRLRKKAYLEKIENTLSYYEKENKKLAYTIQKQGKDIKRLTGEIGYLKSVLHNNTAITALLKTINDGLKKLNTYNKKSVIVNNVMQESQKIQDTEVKEQKCSCLLNGKNNVSDPSNYNIFDSIINRHNQTEQSSLQQQLNTIQEKNTECYESMENNVNNKNTLPLILSNIDHTYTVSKKVDVNHDVANKDLENNIDASPLSTTYLMINTPSSIDSRYMQETDCITPVTTNSICNSEETKDTNIDDMDFDELTPFNVNLFEDIPKCDEIMSSIDLEVPNSCTEEDLFQNLNNTGICLHVNSNKISLEYCAKCHINSTNSDIE